MSRRGRGRGRGGASFGGRHVDWTSDRHTHEEFGEEQQIVRPIPTSNAAWVIGLLNCGNDPWLLQQVETDVFKEARRAIHKKTKLDIDWIVAACAALHKGKTAIPQLGVSVLEYCKDQATSSITIGLDDSVRYNGILRLAAEKSSGNSTSWLTWRGQHDCLDKDGTLAPAPGKAHRFFWHDGTLFSIELKPDVEEIDSWGDITRNPGLIVRCFGGTYEPVDELIAYVERQAALRVKLSVTRMVADSCDETTEREKRPLETIDLDPEMLHDIRIDAEDFFHEGTPKFCRDTGVPCRRGYLFYGPPGTGKTSLSVAIPSHVNVPLITITLSGMDDNMLERAFSRLPYRCVVLIEDIDCVGADLGRRSKPKTSKSDTNSDSLGDVIDTTVAASLIEQSMDKFFHRQEQYNQTMLRLVNDTLQGRSSQQGGGGRTDPAKAPIIPTPKKINLGPLLNVIDGATAAEGRLLIMTTNHAENIDPALLRNGRVDRHFEIGYATKITAELTFKRIFGQDTCRRHTVEAINRYARAFRDQFPVRSKITTATLAQYCGQYRGRPRQAVQDFPEYIRKGDDMFSYTIDELDDVPSSSINVTGSFNPELLEEGPEDFCRLDAAPDFTARNVPTKSAQSSWNPLSWVRSSKAQDAKKPQQLLTMQEKDSTSPRVVATKPETASLVEIPAIKAQPVLVVDTPPSPSLRRQAQIKARCASLGLTSKSTTHRESRITMEFTETFDFDEIIGDLSEPSPGNRISSPVPMSPSPSPCTSEESEWDNDHNRKTAGVHSTPSVRFSEPGKLRLVLPRPIAESTFNPEDPATTTHASDVFSESGSEFLSRITLDRGDFCDWEEIVELEPYEHDQDTSESESVDCDGSDIYDSNDNTESQNDVDGAGSDGDGEDEVFFDAD